MGGHFADAVKNLDKHRDQKDALEKLCLDLPEKEKGRQQTDVQDAGRWIKEDRSRAHSFHPLQECVGDSAAKAHPRGSSGVTKFL